MKKDELEMVRLLTLAAFLGFSFLILVFAIGGNEFSAIVNKLNTNIYGVSEEENSLYNLYYYTGLNAIYQLLYSLTILLVAVSFLGIFFRIPRTGYMAVTGSVMTIATGAFLLVARIFEGFASVHALIDSFYMDSVSKDKIVTAQHLDRFPVLYILLIVLGVLSILLVRSSGITRVKLYNKNRGVDAVAVIMPALVVYLFAGLARVNLLALTAERGTVNVAAAYEYLRDYYLGGKLFFNWSYMNMLVAATILCIVVRKLKLLKGTMSLIVCVGIPSAVTVALSVIYGFNPPALFGYLTTDVSLCDMTDNAFYSYLAAFSVAMVTGYLVIWLVINGLMRLRGFCCIYAVDIAIGVVLTILVKGKPNLSAQFIPWLAGDIVAFFACVITATVSFGKKS